MRHAFVDESRRGEWYLMAAVVVPVGRLAITRTALRALVRPGQRRIHFKTENAVRRQSVLTALAAADARVLAARCRGVHDRPARQLCLETLAASVVRSGVSRLVIESCQHEDHLDRATLARVLRKDTSVSSYEHLRPTEDPLLWAADAAAWCLGEPAWARRFPATSVDIVELTRESAKPGNRPSDR